MAKVIKDITLGLDDELEEKLGWLAPQFSQYRILRQSVDARKKRDIKMVYTVEVAGPNETLSDQRILLNPASPLPDKPIIVGAGPAGLFAALRFVERGVPCLLIERGSPAEARIKGINRFWRYGELDPQNNVCFGEGGAGLYSDGKLITRIKSPHIPYVLQRLTDFGAPAEIQYLANPHVGSDKIRRLIPRIREYLVQKGCQIYFDTQVKSLITTDSKIKGVMTNQGPFYSESVILATGHSATDTLEILHQQGVFMEGKSFAMGLRIEHPQELINQCQYGENAQHPKLKAANYRLTEHDHKTGVGVYSFCMCPGGFVLSSGTEIDGLVCNGMSNFNRGSKFANAAIVVSLDHQKLFGADLWGGMKLRRQLEQQAYLEIKQQGGTKELPVQKVSDFLNGQMTRDLPAVSSPSGVRLMRLDKLLPSYMAESIKKGLIEFDKLLPGFASNKGHLYGVESRTSCPLRITRDEKTLQSLSHQGLYPCGEGAGYAGGITSAACDGIRVADQIMHQ